MKKIIIGNYEFENYPLSAYDGIELLADLMPYITAGYEKFQGNASPIELMMSISSKMDGKTVTSLMSRVLAKTLYNKSPINMADVEWNRKIHVLFDLTWQVLQEEYSDFLLELGLKSPAPPEETSET